MLLRPGASRVPNFFFKKKKKNSDGKQTFNQAQDINETSQGMCC